MKYIKTQESFLNKEIPFNFKQIAELKELGFKHTDFSLMDYQYKPIVPCNITNIIINRIELIKSIDPTWYNSLASQYKVVTTLSTGKKIIKYFPDISTSAKILKKIGIIKFINNGDEYFEQALEYLKEQIPKIDEEVNKYNL